MKKLLAIVASVIVVVTLASCGSKGSDSDKQDPKKAFCAGIAFDYARMMDLSVSGSGGEEGAEASRGYLKKLYTTSFVDGSPDQSLGQHVADGAKKAVAGNLSETEVDAYVEQFNQLKAENEDEC